LGPYLTLRKLNLNVANNNGLENTGEEAITSASGAPEKGKKDILKRVICVL
jgi:hypothetical protein